MSKYVKEVWYQTDEQGNLTFLTDDIHETNLSDKKGYVIVNEENPESVSAKSIYDDYFEATYMMALIYNGVAIGPDYVVICHDGEELVYWNQTEWVEEPLVVRSMANAIRLYYEKGPNHIRMLLQEA